ncbi:MAG: YncE family protein [Myxococcota bacterium]|nr:YncE family protein [Myxococcota bacterium]
MPFSRSSRSESSVLVLLALVVALAAAPAWAARRRHEDTGFQLFTSPQSKPIVLNADGSRLYVANTTSNSVSVVSTASNSQTKTIEVGMDPVGLALRPDGLELWVANHVSDSVSVIDLNPASDTFEHVVATIDDFDANGATRFDEPAAIVFASNGKAYVSLSSTNDIAVVDVATRTITNRLHITAQDPRAMMVRGGRLYVAVFESFNQSELSICPDGGSGPQCTMDSDDLANFVVQSPNIPGAEVNIVKDPDAPDRDLYVYDTATDDLLDVVDGVGTLLYGVTVSHAGHQVFVTQTDARNEVNGQDLDELEDLDNRMFTNEVAQVDCATIPCSFSRPADVLDLEGGAPTQANALATPYGVQISGDDTTLVATAAGSSRLFTVDASTLSLLGTVDLDAGVPADAGQQIPRGLALRSDAMGAPETAYVLNTLENTVSVIDVSTPGTPTHQAKIAVGADPTPDAVRRGRIAFNNGFGASNGSFSCASCHPDGNTDQLLWRIGGDCDFCGPRVDEVRSTMPVRGLKNTLPLHWDGTLGDPFGGPNGATGAGGNGGSDCALGPVTDPDRDHACFRALVDSSLSGVMCDQSGPGCPTGPSGLDGELTTAEREDMAFFLANVSYPPARDRPMDDLVTASALAGFADFFADLKGPGTDLGDLLDVDTCADMNSGCHSLPLGVDTNSSTLGGFDVPTMRGMYDRTLQFSVGITNAEETLVFANSPGTIFLPGVPFPIGFAGSDNPWDPADGFEEDVTFAAAFAIFAPVYGEGSLDMFQMFEEASTGHSGAIGRQVTVNQDTTTGGNLAATEAMLDLLEQADADGNVNLRGSGVRGGGATAISYRHGLDDYVTRNAALSRAAMIAEAQAGTLNVTLTAFLAANYGKPDYHQPLLAPNTTADDPSIANWNPDLPVLPGDDPMTLTGIDVRSDAIIYMDGVPVGGTISCVGGIFDPYCDSQEVIIDLDATPAGDGPHLLQVKNPKGPLSNEMLVCVGSANLCNI